MVFLIKLFRILVTPHALRSSLQAKAPRTRSTPSFFWSAGIHPRFGPPPSARQAETSGHHSGPMRAQPAAALPNPASTPSAVTLVFTANIPMRRGPHSRPKLRELGALQGIARSLRGKVSWRHCLRLSLPVACLIQHESLSNLLSYFS